MKTLIYIATILLLISFSSVVESSQRSGMSLRFKKFASRIRSELRQEPPEKLPQELPDVDQTGQHTLAQFMDIYKGHHMSAGEIKLVFRIADRTKDNRVSFAEWADFHTIFVQPFEMVDQREEYWLDEADIAFAIDQETGGDWLSGIDIEADEVNDLVRNFDRWAVENNLNFCDYLFLRKANLAMTQCASEEGISARQMPCALAITSPGRLLTTQDCIEIFQMIHYIKGGQKVGSLKQLKFVDWVEVAHLFWYFTEFSLPFDNGTISKSDVLRGIDLNALPTTLTPTQVQDMYSGIAVPLSFTAFGALLWMQRNFARFDDDKSGKLSFDEWNALLDQKDFNPFLLELIDGLEMPTQEEIEDVAIKRIGAPANEKDFLMNSFLQARYRSHHRSHLKHRKFGFKHRSRQNDAPEYDDPPRKIIYRLFDSSLSEEMSFKEFVQFLKYSWLFQSYDASRSGKINDLSFWKGTKDQVWCIPMSKAEQQNNADAGDWIGGNVGMSLNLKQFFIWFRSNAIFQWLKTSGMNVHTIQAKLHQGFVQLGLRLASSTENLLQDGFDQLTSERHYHFKQIIQYSLADEVAALKIRSAFADLG